MTGTPNGALTSGMRCQTRKGVSQGCTETGFPKNVDKIDYKLTCPQNAIATGIKHGFTKKGNLHYNMRCCKVDGELKNCRQTEMFKKEEDIRIPHGSSIVDLESKLDTTDDSNGILFRVCDVFGEVGALVKISDKNSTDICKNLYTRKFGHSEISIFTASQNYSLI